MNLMCIIGSTGVGKTNLSIEYAKKYGAPVVVLDRIQCFKELSITSGRPEEKEFQGTKRHYLTDLMVELGSEKLNKDYYIKNLIELLNEINSTYITLKNKKSIGCILEGGSITLLREILPKINSILPYRVTSIIYIRPNDTIENHNIYKSKIFKRVSEMLFPLEVDQDSQIKEIQRILNKNNKNLENIKNVLISLIGLVGVEKVFEYIENQKYYQLNLNEASLKEVQVQLIQSISYLHYSYALSQIEVMDNLIKQLPKSIKFTKKSVKL